MKTTTTFCLLARPASSLWPARSPLAPKSYWPNFARPSSRPHSLTHTNSGPRHTGVSVVPVIIESGRKSEWPKWRWRRRRPPLMRVNKIYTTPTGDRQTGRQQDGRSCWRPEQDRAADSMKFISPRHCRRHHPVHLNLRPNTGADLWPTEGDALRIQTGPSAKLVCKQSHCGRPALWLSEYSRCFRLSLCRF